MVKAQKGPAMSDITLTTTIQDDREEAGSTSHHQGSAAATLTLNPTTLMIPRAAMERVIEEGECVMIGTETGIESGSGSAIASEKGDVRGIWTARERRSAESDSTCDGRRWNVGRVVTLTQIEDGSIRDGTRGIEIK